MPCYPFNLLLTTRQLEKITKVKSNLNSFKSCNEVKILKFKPYFLKFGWRDT